MNHSTSNPLLHLREAYVRLGLDAFARGIEQLSVWLQWSEKQSNWNQLDAREQQALEQVLLAIRKFKGDGGDCMVQLPLDPALQIDLLREWLCMIPTWNKMSFAQQRGEALVHKNKEFLNAFCTRRARDDWKRNCSVYAEALADCVHLTRDLMEELWHGDLAHHVVFQLVRAAPTELALLLAQQLPEASLVPLSARYTYERAMVCLLRTRCPQAVGVLKVRALPKHSLPLRCAWLLHIAAHFVTHGNSGGARVLRMLLQLSDEHGHELASDPARLLFLQRCLRIREDTPLQEAQLALAARAKTWGRKGFAHEPQLPAWLTQLTADSEKSLSIDETRTMSAHIPDQESFSGEDSRQEGDDTQEEARHEKIFQSKEINAFEVLVSWAPTAYWRISQSENNATVCFFLHLPRAER